METKKSNKSWESEAAKSRLNHFLLFLLHFLQLLTQMEKKTQVIILW